MLFSSPIFIFVFLPLTFVGYFVCTKMKKYHMAQWLLIFASFSFYAYFNYKYVPILFFSILGNYLFGNWIRQVRYKKIITIIGVLLNLAVLGYFKYTDFFISSFNTVAGTDFPLLKLLLPLALSFCTFQQIAYLIDIYKGKTNEYSLRSYFLFVSFFPQLIAGPIVHHKEMMPQFEVFSNLKINFNNILLGLSIFGIGIFKKMVIADSFAIWADEGFNNYKVLDFWDAWKTSLSYYFQIYYDFSGYVDMAIGAALLFNIRLPSNFNSPYRAANIQDFWHRWHMTLSRWMRDYIYIPLGGNRSGKIMMLRNLFITAFASGIWHGAGWTFVVWGILHGIAMVIHRIWQDLGFKMNKYLAWFVTFIFINITWIFFRADSLSQAARIIRAMFGVGGGVLPNLDIINIHTALGKLQILVNYSFLVIVAIVLIFTIFLPNSTKIYENKEISLSRSVLFALLFSMGITMMFSSRSTVFLYYNF